MCDGPLLVLVVHHHRAVALHMRHLPHPRDNKVTCVLLENSTVKCSRSVSYFDFGVVCLAQDCTAVPNCTRIEKPLFG